MSKASPTHYDFNDKVFQIKRNWMTYAKEHAEMWDLQYNSDVISYTVLSTVSHLAIPSTYLVTYKLNSITGITADKAPVYGKEHVLEITLPTRYPLEPARIFMKSDVWHPNIQSTGRFKGKICGNVDGFGVDYTLLQLVLRVGEMLQFRNYLAEFRPPYPEDPEAARWVKEVAEPTGIVNRGKGVFTDEQPLLRSERREPPPAVKIISTPSPAEPVPDKPDRITEMKIKKRTDDQQPPPRRRLKF